jgi:hypothetical protein
MKDLIVNLASIPIFVAIAAFWVVAYHLIVWLFHTLNSAMGF